jgi:hypothetical protein
MPVYLYMRSNNYVNHFLTVCRSATAIQPFCQMDRLDGDSPHRLPTQEEARQRTHGEEMTGKIQGYWLVLFDLPFP